MESVVNLDFARFFKLILPDYGDPEWKMYRRDSENTIGFYDITNVLQQIAESFRVGNMTIQPPHTTMRVIANERQDGYLKDLVDSLQRDFPAENDILHYYHNDHHVPPTCKNAHAHLMADRFPLTQGILIIDGLLNLGNYLGILAMDLYPLEEGKTRMINVYVSGVPYR